MTQQDLFLQSEANAWFYRNEHTLLNKKKDDDIIFKEIMALKEKTNCNSYLEIGCSNGFRLSWVKTLGFSVCGIGPSVCAIESGRERYNMTSQELCPIDAYSFFEKNTACFDIISFAHALYLIPPNEIPFLVAKAISSLNDNGFIIIFDFDSIPQREPYKHQSGITSYKANMTNYFTWMPFMRLVKKHVIEHQGDMSIGNPKEDCALSVIRKITMDLAFPEIKGSEVKEKKSLIFA